MSLAMGTCQKGVIAREKLVSIAGPLGLPRFARSDDGGAMLTRRHRERSVAIQCFG